MPEIPAGGLFCFLETALREVPDRFLFADLILKAMPAEEGGKRFIYMEASNEGLDYQGETVLQKALQDSADYFLKYGNLDLDHLSLLGKPNPAKGHPGIPDYELYEIGKPIDVRFEDGRTYVKGEIRSGSGIAAEKANQFWSSLTEVTPPARWYPSVGGGVLDRDADAGVVKAVRWCNVGFSKTPVNSLVPTADTVPFAVFAKAMCGGVACTDLSKTLSAGSYGTDAAGLVGGAALTAQSLDGAVRSYWDFRERAAADVRRGRIKNGTVAGLIAHAVAQYGVEESTAAEWVERFLKDSLSAAPRLVSHLKQRSTR